MKKTDEKTFHLFTFPKKKNFTLLILDPSSPTPWDPELYLDCFEDLEFSEPNLELPRVNLLDPVRDTLGEDVAPYPMTPGKQASIKQSMSIGC